MTLLAFSDCCELLAVDPKTLRAYLKRAGMHLVAHPTDARIKGLTLAQLHHLAALHGRFLPEPKAPAEERTEVCAQPVRPLLAESAAAQTDLHLRLAQLEGHLLALQQQVTSLTTCLLQRADPPGQAGLAVPSIPFPSPPRPLAGQAALEPTDQMRARASSPSPWHPAHPGERRRRPVLPLIEYGAQGRYVLICPQEGELPIVPDSEAWFSWLASLASFRFLGQAGRFSASRVCDHGPKRTWYAYRVIHQHTYKHYLGTTDRLTVARLEQMAATLQSYVPSL